MHKRKRIELLCVSDSSLDSSIFSKVFMHPPLLSEIMKYLSLKDATILSQALRYCRWTSDLSRIILYSFGAGRTQPPLNSEYEDAISSIHMSIESKKVKLEIQDTSGLALENPFTDKFHVVRVVACTEYEGDDCEIWVS